MKLILENWQKFVNEEAIQEAARNTLSNKLGKLLAKGNPEEREKIIVDFFKVLQTGQGYEKLFPTWPKMSDDKKNSFIEAGKKFDINKGRAKEFKQQIIAATSPQAVEDKTEELVDDVEAQTDVNIDQAEQPQEQTPKLKEPAEPEKIKKLATEVTSKLAKTDPAEVLNKYVKMAELAGNEYWNSIKITKNEHYTYLKTQLDAIVPNILAGKAKISEYAEAMTRFVQNFGALNDTQRKELGTFLLLAKVNLARKSPKDDPLADIKKQYPQVATTFKDEIQQKAVHYFLFFAKQKKLITEVEGGPDVLSPIFGDDEVRKKLAKEILNDIKKLDDGAELYEALLKIMTNEALAGKFKELVTAKPEEPTETDGGTDPEKIDPDPKKLKALQDSFVNFRDKFYTKKKLTEQAALVNDLLAKLKAFNDEESAEAFKRNPNRKKAAGKRDDLSENEETEIIAKSKDIRNFKASVRSFRRAMQKSKQLVSNAMTDTKKGKLVGYGSRKKVVEFATETQKRIKILNNSINLILGPAERGSLQEKFSPEVQKKVDKYQETLDLIEDVFEDIVGTDVSKGGIGNIIDKIVNKVDMEYSEIKIGVDNALKKLSTIKKYFPSIIPFQGSKIESTNIVSEYEAAIKNLNLSSSDIQTLNDALEGEQGKIAILNFQDRLIEFSGDIERIFGIAGLKEKDAAEPVKVQGDIDDTERKEKSGNYVVDEYGADEFFKDMKENVKQSFFKMLNLLHSKGLFKENISNMYKELEKTDSVKAVRIKAAISGLDEKDQSNIKTYLNNAGGGNKFIEFLKRTKFFKTEVDDSGETTAADDEDDTEEKEELSLKNQTEIDQFFKAEFLDFKSQLRDLNDRFGGNFADNFKQLIMYYLWFKNSQQPKKDKTNENKEDQGPRLNQYARDALKKTFGLDKQTDRFESLLRLKARPMIEFMNKIYEKKSDINRNKVITGFIDKLNNLNVKIGNLQLPTIAKLAGDKDSEKEKQKQAALADLDEYLKRFNRDFKVNPIAEKTIIKQILEMLINRDLHIPEKTESSKPVSEEQNTDEEPPAKKSKKPPLPYENVVPENVNAAFDSEVAPDIIDIFDTFFKKSKEFSSGSDRSQLIKAVIKFFTDNKNKFKDVLKKGFFRRAASEVGRIAKGLVNKAKRATKKTQQEQLEIALRPLIEKLMRGE